MQMNPLTIDLSGKIAVVTGGTSQLGRAMVRTLAQCGADVAFSYSKNAELAKILKSDVEMMGRKAMVEQVDVTDKASVDHFQRRTEAELGTATIVVCNAVSQVPWKSVLEQDPADYTNQFSSCVLHAVHVTQSFVPAIIALGKGGRVIGINTECAMHNAANESAYSSAKRGMDGIMRALAKEIGEHGITVNQVAPGWTVSDNARESGTEEQPQYAARVPLKRRGTDQEIANVVAFIASDLASFISGTYLPVSGGIVMPAI